MAISEYLQAGYQRVRAERTTIMWAALALFSRLAPLSAMPLMLEFSTIRDADRYALILANASILSIILNFGQVSNMQTRFSDSGFSSVAIQGICTAFAVSIPTTFIGLVSFNDSSSVVISIIFSLAVAVAGQYNTLLRCSRNFTVATYAEITRIAIFFASILAITYYKRVGFEFMVAIMVVYYALPYILLVLKVDFSLTNLRKAKRQLWEDRARLLYWTFSAGLSAGAWVSIRYMVVLYGDEGDLAKFSSIMSICSAGVIIADILYTRISREIILHVENRRGGEVVRIMKGVVLVSSLAFIAMLFASLGYIYFLLPADMGTIALASLLSLGYSVRFFYVFGQQIMIARGLATYDLVGGAAMMFVALAASLILIPGAGVAGAGASFLFTALAMLAVVSWGVRRHWSAS